LTKPQKLTESGLARELDVSRQAIHDLVKRGILQKDAEGLIDRTQATQALLNRVRPSGKTTASMISQEETPLQPLKQPLTTQPEPDESTEITSYHIAKTLREAAEAQIAHLKLAEMRNDLIRIAAVKAALATVFATTRDAMLQIPARLAPTLAADADPANVQNVLHEEIHRALMHLSGAAERMGQTDGEVQ